MEPFRRQKTFVTSISNLIKSNCKRWCYNIGGNNNESPFAKLPCYFNFPCLMRIAFGQRTFLRVSTENTVGLDLLTLYWTATLDFTLTFSDADMKFTSKSVIFSCKPPYILWMLKEDPDCFRLNPTIQSISLSAWLVIIWKLRTSVQISP